MLQNQIDDREFAVMDKAEKMDLDTSTDEAKDDMMYFKTLLGFLDKVSDEQKLLFREEVLNLVRKFAYPTREEKKKMKHKDGKFNSI